MPKADELGKTIENSVMMRQFDNEAGPDIHRRTTAEEIWAGYRRPSRCPGCRKRHGRNDHWNIAASKRTEPKDKKLRCSTRAPLPYLPEAMPPDTHSLESDQTLSPRFSTPVAMTKSSASKTPPPLTSRGEPPPKRVFWRVYPRELPFGQPAKLQLVQSLRASK